jgi:hypothetical protein
MVTICATEGRQLAEEEHLALANRHIAEAGERIGRQSALIEWMAAAGCETSLSECLLHELERALDLMYVHRAQIMRELAELSRANEIRS